MNTLTFRPIDLRRGRGCGNEMHVGFEVGDEVVGFVRNGLSEYVSAEEDSFIKKPSALR